MFHQTTLQLVTTLSKSNLVSDCQRYYLVQTIRNTRVQSGLPATLTLGCALTRSSESDGRSDVTDKFRFFVCNEMVRFFLCVTRW